ncbi:hypothetical protein FJY90_07160, partial [Candidatus Gottesmanbacteria bacterium]|nr:hypothetical protein [Candidatus Gottesmanbacteria bacterium]
KEINYLPAVSASVATSAKEAASAKEGQQLTANSQPLITTTRYYFTNGKRIAQRKTVQNQESGIKNQGLTFIHSDHLLSSTLFTDNQGNQKDSLLTYYPYGETRPGWDTPVQATTATNRLYTSQLRDTETDLYYYHNRYYNQKTGLFISPDTNSSSVNRYAYVDNNPLRFFDPTGKDKIEPREFKEFYTSIAGFFEPGSPEAKVAFMAACAPVALAVGVLMGAGADTGVDIMEVTTGTDILTGQPLGLAGRAVSAVSMALPFVPGSAIRHGAKAAAKGTYEFAGRAANRFYQLVPKGLPAEEIIEKALAAGIPLHAINKYTDELAIQLFQEAKALGIQFKFPRLGGTLRKGSAEASDVAGELGTITVKKGSFDVGVLRHEIEHIMKKSSEIPGEEWFWTEWRARLAAYEYVLAHYAADHPLVAMAEEHVFDTILDYAQHHYGEWWLDLARKFGVDPADLRQIK